MGTTGNWIGQIGGAVGSLFQSQGNVAEANSYTSAAELDTQNAALVAASTRIQSYQQARTVTQSLGATQADVAGAGFTESGSALAILKSSAQQGALANSLTNIQGAINENAYAAEAGANLAKAKAANEANTAGTISAIASIGGALVNGSQQLLSAGQTVVKGAQTVYDSIFGSAAATASSSAALNATGLGAEFSGGAIPGGLGADFSLEGVSATDSAISAGGNLLGASSSSAVADIGGFTTIDTSAAALGSDAATAASDLASAAGDAIPVLGEVLLAAQALQLIGVGGFVGEVAGDITGAVSSVVGGVVDAVSSVGKAIGSVFGSVICTAYYKRGMLSRPVWNAAQRYGRDIAPPHIYAAYLLWGRPLARRITESECFAKMVAPVFIPWAHELAVLAGEKTAKRTTTGRVVFKVTYAFSWVLGYFLMGVEHARSNA